MKAANYFERDSTRIIGGSREFCFGKSLQMRGIPAAKVKKDDLISWHQTAGLPAISEEMLNNLALMDDCQLVVVCGRNERLKDNLRRVSLLFLEYILGFVDNVQESMSQATCIVTKARWVNFDRGHCFRLPIFYL